MTKYYFQINLPTKYIYAYKQKSFSRQKQLHNKVKLHYYIDITFEDFY